MSISAKFAETEEDNTISIRHNRGFMVLLCKCEQMSATAGQKHHIF